MNRAPRPDPRRGGDATPGHFRIRLGEYVPGLGFRVLTPPVPLTAEMITILDEEEKRLGDAGATCEKGAKR